MYLSNYERFLSTARFWTESYAMPSEAVAGAEVHPILISSTTISSHSSSLLSRTVFLLPFLIFPYLPHCFCPFILLMLLHLHYVAICFHAYYYVDANIIIDLTVAQAHPAVKRLVEMGFVEADCRKALLLHKGAYLLPSLCLVCSHFFITSLTIISNLFCIYSLLAFLRYYDDLQTLSNL